MDREARRWLLQNLLVVAAIWVPLLAFGYLSRSWSTALLGAVVVLMLVTVARARSRR
jgi:hypothetical protein